MGIVDALRLYNNPVFIYLPPHSELRGGSWVVVDPTINEEKMEMYADLESSNEDFDAGAESDIKKQIKAREELLKPVYTQVATEFADLHDKTGRMKAKGVIKAAVEWSSSREYFYYLTKRRLLQDSLVEQIKDADDTLNTELALKKLQDMCPADWEDNKAVLEYMEEESAVISAAIKNTKTQAIKAKIDALNAELGDM